MIGSIIVTITSLAVMAVSGIVLVKSCFDVIEIGWSKSSFEMKWLFVLICGTVLGAWIGMIKVLIDVWCL